MPYKPEAPLAIDRFFEPMALRATGNRAPMLAVYTRFMYLASQPRVKAREFNGTPEVCLGLAAAVNPDFMRRATDKRSESHRGHCLWSQDRPQPAAGPGFGERVTQKQVAAAAPHVDQGPP
jgi:hypothetical protein